MKAVRDDGLVDVDLTATVDGQTVLAKARAVVRPPGMKIERSMHNEISAAEVYEMSVTKAYQEKKCQDAGALSWDVDVERDGDVAVVRTKRKLPTVGFPSLLRKFVPSGVTSTETVTWGPAAVGRHPRPRELSVDFHGAPASMKGTVRVVPDGADRRHGGRRRRVQGARPARRRRRSRASPRRSSST